MTDLMARSAKTKTPKSSAGPKTTGTDSALDMQKTAGNQATGKLAEKKADTKKVKAPTETAGTATSAFTKLAPVVDAVVPTDGSSGAITAELKIPLSHGAFVGVRVAATAARVDEKAVELGVEANVTAGASVGVAHAKFELGAYMKVHGADAKQALTIVSWTLYRQLAESPSTPREVEQAWFGDKKGKSAESWDADVRKTLFAKESGNWSEIGAQLAAGVGASGGFGSAEGKVQAQLGRRYDEKSIKNRGAKDVKSTSQKVLGAIGIDRGSQASLGDRIFRVIGSASITTPLASGSLTVSAAVRQVKDKTGSKEKTTYELAEVIVDGTASCAGLGIAANALAGGIAVRNLLKEVSDKAGKATDKAKKQLEADEKKTKARAAGSAVADLANVEDSFSSAVGALGGVSLDIPGLAASGQIHVNGGYADKKPFLKILFEKLTALNVDVGVFALSAVKTERLASIEYGDGKWVAHLGELSKELGKSPTKATAGASAATTPKPGAKPGSGGTGGVKSGGKP